MEARCLMKSAGSKNIHESTHRGPDGQSGDVTYSLLSMFRMPKAA
jgi:hypothetical protein